MVQTVVLSREIRLLRYVLINKPTGHHPGAPLEGFPQEASRGPSARGRDRSLETIGARLPLWKTFSSMPEANPCQKASFTAAPILTSFFPNVPILCFPDSPIRRSPGQYYYQHAPAHPASTAPPPGPRAHSSAREAGGAASAPLVKTTVPTARPVLSVNVQTDPFFSTVAGGR